MHRSFFLVIGLIATVVAAGCGEGDVAPPRPPRNPSADPTPDPTQPAIDPNFKPFPAADPKVVKLPSGVAYLDLAKDKAPHGKVIEAGQTGKFSYSGWLETGMRFDASYAVQAQGPPKKEMTVDFTLKTGRMIDGFVDGCAGMREGDRRLIFIPWEKGYGEAGNPQAKIGTKQNLVFEVALWEVVPTPAEVPDAANFDASR